MVEMVSTDDDSPYSKSEAFVKQSDGFIYQSKFYDNKKGKFIKKLSIVETKMVEGIIVPTKMIMDDKKDGSKTLLIMNDVTINKGVPAETFTIQNLNK